MVIGYSSAVVQQPLTSRFAKTNKIALTNYTEKSIVKRKFNLGVIIGEAAGALAGNFITFEIAVIHATVVACAGFLFAEIIFQKQSNNKR